MFMQQGATFMMGRKVDGAIAKFRQAVQSEPNCGLCHRTLADALARKSDRDAAIAEYREAVRIEPGNPELHFVFGTQLEARGATLAHADYHFDPKRRTRRSASSSLPKPARNDYESALEHDRLVQQLAPDNTSYREACERLASQLRTP